MYAHYFGLRENPFTITPNPRYLFLGARHSEALAHLIYGVTESGGFIQLTGEVGTGKTMLVRSLIEQLPNHVDIALIFNPQMELSEFLRAICRELGVPVQFGQSAAGITQALNRHLLTAHASGRRVVLIVDEAQNLPRDLLEQVRMLTNLETRNHKLIQIVLVGQPELGEILARRDLRQLSQRVTGRYHLPPLDRAETHAYVEHRLGIAGAGGKILTATAMRRLYRLSGGVPRLINIIADRALLGAYAARRRECNAGLVRQAGREILPTREKPRRRLRLTAAALAVVALGLASALAWRWDVAADHSAAVKTRLASDAPAEASSAQPPPQRTIGGQPSRSNDDPLAAWLQKAGASAGTDAAFTTLFSLWGASYLGGNTAPACRQAEARGLRCLYRQGTWRELTDYNRPAIVTLTLANGRHYQAVVSALSRDSVTLRAGAASKTVPLAVLRRDWNGQFLLLWRPPPHSDGLLHAGMAGPGVAWLGKHLSTLSGGSTIGTDANAYGGALTDAVKRFQQSRGLKVDGIAGERTLIELNGALNNIDIPRLDTPGSHYNSNDGSNNVARREG